MVLYSIVAPSFSNTYNWLISSDYNISNRDQLRGRYISNTTASLDTSASLPVFFYPRPTTAKLGSISEFHNFSPNVNNEDYDYLQPLQRRYSSPEFLLCRIGCFPERSHTERSQPEYGPDPNGPQATVQTTYQIVDNVSSTKGRHDLKFGFDGRDLIAASTFIQRNRGDYEWTTLQVIPQRHHSRLHCATQRRWETVFR